MSSSAQTAHRLSTGCPQRAARPNGDATPPLRVAPWDGARLGISAALPQCCRIQQRFSDPVAVPCLIQSPSDTGSPTVRQWWVVRSFVNGRRLSRVPAQQHDLAPLIDSIAGPHAVLDHRPLLAQVATDAGSGTLGLVVVAGNEVVGGPHTVDQAMAEQVLADGRLEPYRIFWSPTSRGEELNPSPGCSVPTYHGSAADLAATAGSIVGLLGQQLTAPASGVHLFAAAHSGTQPSYRFEPYMVTERTIDPTTAD